MGAAGALGGVFGYVVPLGTALSLGLALLEGLIHPKDGSLGTMRPGLPSKGDIQVLLPPCPSRDPAALVRPQQLCNEAISDPAA